MDTVNEIVKFIILATTSYLMFYKISRATFDPIKKIVIGIFFVAFTSASLFFLKFIVGEPLKTAIMVCVSSILFALVFKKRFEVTLTAFMVSYAISYILYLLTLLIAIIIMDLFGVVGDSIFIIILASIFNVACMVFISKVRLHFNFNENKGAGGIGLIISGVVFIFYGLLRENVIDKEMNYMIVGVALTGYGIYYWWKRESIIAHNTKVNESIHKKLQITIEQKEKDYAILSEAHDYLASVVHKDNKKLDAMQRVIEKLLLRTQQVDIIVEAQKILDTIKIYRKQTSDEQSRKLNSGKTLPLTGLQLVDAKFEVLLETATMRNIDFDLEVRGSITDIEEQISQLDLVNLIGDFAENAFIAIKHATQNNAFKGIFISIGKQNDVFELSVKDSGIPFEVHTLINLGQNRVTTHADDNGSGYGYVTVFEKMKKYGVSLCISEYEPLPYAYVKNVTLRFDGKVGYAIESYRADIIRMQNNNKNLAIYPLPEQEKAPQPRHA